MQGVIMFKTPSNSSTVCKMEWYGYTDSLDNKNYVSAEIKFAPFKTSCSINTEAFLQDCPDHCKAKTQIKSFLF